MGRIFKILISIFIVGIIIAVLISYIRKFNTSKHVQKVSRAIDTSISLAPIISVEYSYSGKDAIYGIATEARFKTNRSSIPFATARAVGICDEVGERRYKVIFKLPGKGNQTDFLVARFRFTGQGAQIRKVTLSNRWETHYIFPIEKGDLRLGIPRVETYDLATGKKVAETKNIRVVPLINNATERAVSSQIVKDFRGFVISQTWKNRTWAFSGEEHCYENDRLVFVSTFIRDLATGLLIKETIKKGKLPRDYHHYELVVISWPDGSMMGTKIDLVPLSK